MVIRIKKLDLQFSVTSGNATYDPATLIKRIKLYSDKGNLLKSKNISDSDTILDASGNYYITINLTIFNRLNTI